MDGNSEIPPLVPPLSCSFNTPSSLFLLTFFNPPPFQTWVATVSAAGFRFVAHESSLDETVSASACPPPVETMVYSFWARIITRLASAINALYSATTEGAARIANTKQ